MMQPARLHRFALYIKLPEFSAPMGAIGIKASLPLPGLTALSIQRIDTFGLVAQITDRFNLITAIFEKRDCLVGT